MEFFYSCIMTFSLLTDQSVITNSGDTSEGRAVFFFPSVTPCTAKQEQYRALLEAHFRFPALEEGSHILIFQQNWKYENQPDQLSMTEDPAVQSEKGKYHRLIFLKLCFYFLCFWCNDTYSSWQHINPICSRMLSILRFFFFLLNLVCNLASYVQHGRNPHQNMFFAGEAVNSQSQKQ